MTLRLYLRKTRFSSKHFMRVRSGLRPTLLDENGPLTAFPDGEAHPGPRPRLVSSGRWTPDRLRRPGTWTASQDARFLLAAGHSECSSVSRKSRAHVFAALATMMAVLPIVSASRAEEFTCTLASVQQTRYGVMVNCKETFSWNDTIDPKRHSEINFFAPDATLNMNSAKIPPPYTSGQTMLAFETIALEAFRENKPLNVSFTPGLLPGRLFDCRNENCRLARAWSIMR